MKRYNDYGNPVRTSKYVSFQALIDYCDDLAEAVERLEKKVEFIMEHKFSHTTNTIECYKLKDLYQSTQDL